MIHGLIGCLVFKTHTYRVVEVFQRFHYRIRLVWKPCEAFTGACDNDVETAFPAIFQQPRPFWPDVAHAIQDVIVERDL